MEYQVPQFIEVEDKIIGPLTLKQFIYMAGGAGLCVICYFYLPFIVAVLFIIPIGGFAVALTFYKVNGKPFIDVLEAAFTYYIGAKLFLWKREEKKIDSERRSTPKTEAAPINVRAVPRLTSDKLHDLAWSLDVKGKEADAEREQTL